MRRSASGAVRRVRSVETSTRAGSSRTSSDTRSAAAVRAHAVRAEQQRDVVRARRVGDAKGVRRRLEERIGILGVAADVEGELVIGLHELAAVQQVADAPVGIRLEIADQLRPPIGVEPAKYEPNAIAAAIGQCAAASSSYPPISRTPSQPV